MIRSKSILFFVFLFGAAIASIALLRNLNTEIDFNTQVKPILNQHCIACHGGVKQSGDLSMMTLEDLLKSGESGHPAIVPGKPNESEFYKRIISKDEEERMPYDAAPLSKEKVKIIYQWIKEGAKWGKHWAYESVAAVEVPSSNRVLGKIGREEQMEAQKPIDRFILQKMQAHDLHPSHSADKRTLLRRAALDIIGIPVSKTTAKDFLENEQENAFEILVDSLLASPRYGERWASVWMDIARYADTKGADPDHERSIWEYRDWLIRAFNQDMPYDQFLTEQIAGDLLPNPTDAQYIATGFHRNTMTHDEGGTDNEEFRSAAIVDRVNTTWEGLLGTTFACVQCHGHPYDPIKHEEYYEFFAFFNNTRDHDTFDDYPWLRKFSAEQKAQLAELNNWLEQNTSKQQTQAIDLFIKTWQPAHYSLLADSFTNAEIYDTKFLAFRHNGIARLAEVDLTEKNKLIFRYRTGSKGGQWQLHLDSPTGKVLAQVSASPTSNWEIQSVDLEEVKGKHDLYFTFQNPTLNNPRQAGIQFDWFHFTQQFPTGNTVAHKKYEQLYWDLIKAKTEHTLIMVENPKTMQRKTHVWDRGSWLAKTEEVTPDVPAIFPDFPEDAPQNRLGLAQWLTDEKHPLTARTIVNRVWEQLFGVGLVETLEDLGTQGTPPTHQELLDYLSWQLMHEYNWSIKQLIKTIVLSDTYQQDSKVTDEHQAKDPLNKWYARAPRVRLNAEQIRDQALQVSGLLSEKMYGKSVMPYQPPNIWDTPYDSRDWQISKGVDQYRRSIYTYWKRSSPYPAMLAFDATDRDVCSARRIRTNTPLQALVALNDPSYMEAAVALAVQNYHVDIQVAILFAYEQAIGQSISKEKLDVLQNLYKEMLVDYKNDTASIKAMLPEQETIHQTPEIAALSIVCNSIMNLDEFIVK